MTKFSFINRLRNKIKIIQGSHIELGKKSHMVGCSITIKGQNNRLIVADNVRLRGCVIEIFGVNCVIRIGKDTIVGSNCYLSAKECNISLTIGEGPTFTQYKNHDLRWAFYFPKQEES